jgi:hypothetical protein
MTSVIIWILFEFNEEICFTSCFGVVQFSSSLVVLDLDGVVLFHAELFVVVGLDFLVAGLGSVFLAPRAPVRLHGGSREWPRCFVLSLSIAPSKIYLVFWCSRPGGRGRPWILARVHCRRFGLRAFPGRTPSLWSGACCRLDFCFRCKQGSRSRGRLLGLESCVWRRQGLVDLFPAALFIFCAQGPRLRAPPWGQVSRSLFCCVVGQARFSFPADML